MGKLPVWFLARTRHECSSSTAVGAVLPPAQGDDHGVGEEELVNISWVFSNVQELHIGFLEGQLSGITAHSWSNVTTLQLDCFTHAALVTVSTGLPRLQHLSLLGGLMDEDEDNDDLLDVPVCTWSHLCMLHFGGVHLSAGTLSIINAASSPTLLSVTGACLCYFNNVHEVAHVERDAKQLQLLQEKLGGQLSCKFGIHDWRDEAEFVKSAVHSLGEQCLVACISMHEDVDGYMLPALHALAPFCRHLILQDLSMQRKALNMTVWLPPVLQALRGMQQLRTVSVVSHMPSLVESLKCTQLCTEFHASFVEETSDAIGVLLQ